MPAADLAVRAQPERAEDHDAWRLRRHLESQNVTIERQKVVQVFAPDRCPAQPCDHQWPLPRVVSDLQVGRFRRAGLADSCTASIVEDVGLLVLAPESARSGPG